MPTIQRCLYAIRLKLSSINADIGLCKQLDHDINYKALEETVRRLLNLVYGYNLINLNRERKNHPAIDLGDSNAKLPGGKKGIAVQVTATTGRDKVRHTIRLFQQYRLDKQYDRLVVFVTGDKEKFIKDFDFGNLNFSKENDIWDFGTLMKEIECIADRNPDKIRQIYNFLEKRIAFDPDKYEVYLRECREECALSRSYDVEFVKDVVLFQEIDAFLGYQWLPNLLMEIKHILRENRKITFNEECIDISATMEEISKTVISWLDAHRADLYMDEKEFDKNKKRIRETFYSNCLLIMGDYGSGKTRLVTEAAVNVWHQDTGKEKPVFVFVKPHKPTDIKGSMQDSFAQLLGKRGELEDCLDAFANHPLVIVLDDIHEYFQNNVTLRNLVDIIELLSRPEIKWILLCQTGYATDPCGIYSDDFQKYAHKWSEALRRASVKPWLRLDAWYREVDIPWKILQRGEGIPSGRWASKKQIASTSYYNPLLANVLIIHAYRKNDWSFLNYKDLLFPDFCQRYYWLLSQDKQSVKFNVLRAADYFWKKRSLRLVLKESRFEPKDSDILFNHGLLLLQDSNQFVYQGTPDMVWYYLLAEMVNPISGEKEDSLDSVLEYWKDKPDMLKGILSLRVLEDHRSEEDITKVWEKLFRIGFASIALDSGLKCHKKLRNKLIQIALETPKAIRENFHLFLELCALGVADTETFYGVVDYCVCNCSDEILKFSELFAYMLRQNYAAMKQADVLGVLNHLLPLTAGRKHTNILRKCGEDIGTSIALKVARLSQLKQAIDESRKACDGRESNKYEKALVEASGNMFPAGLFDGFCSSFCNKVIQTYRMNGFESFRNCEWYYFEGGSKKNKKKAGSGKKKMDANQRRRNKSLTFALAYKYRNETNDVDYRKWYERLVQKLSNGSMGDKTFAFFLIKHTGLKEYGYQLPGNSVLLETAKKLACDGAIGKIVKNPKEDCFLNWLKKQS